MNQLTVSFPIFYDAKPLSDNLIIQCNRLNEIVNSPVTCIRDYELRRMVECKCVSLIGGTEYSITITNEKYGWKSRPFNLLNHYTSMYLNEKNSL